jgi:hypothetical protein
MPSTPAPTKAEPVSCRGPAALVKLATADDEVAEAELAAEDADFKAEEASLVTLATRELRAPEPVAVATWLAREEASEPYWEIALATDADSALFVAIAAVREVAALRASE